MSEEFECNRGHAIDDVRIRDIERLVSADDLIRGVPSTQSIRELVSETRRNIHRILTGSDPRLLVVVGPCSVHDSRAALEYARWLRGASVRFADTLLMVMRVYFEKPRTHLGWKGFINDPYLDGSFRINEGMRLARRLLVAINEIGVPTATEFVDLITPQYLGDLISWAAIGARTSESQTHRELASGLSCPVGFKNGTEGNLNVAVNAVLTARNPHHFLSVTKSGVAAIVSTTGNADCHIILRGGAHPNYDSAAVKSAALLLESRGLQPKVMVDCSHANCQGDCTRQLTVAEDVGLQIRNGSTNIIGIMVESNLVAGRQNLISGQPIIFGQSITDSCLGPDDTMHLLGKIAGGRIQENEPPRASALGR